MVEDHAPVGLLIAALGAAALAISVFLPWYGLSITQPGATAAKKQIVAAAHQYGDTTIQTKLSGNADRYTALVGRQLTTVSAHQALKRVSLVLLVLAGIALLASLLRLADTRGLLFATGGQLAHVGELAAVVVAFRIIWHPGKAGDLVALSVTWGAWVALISAATIIGGALLAGSGQTHKRRRPKRGPGAVTAQVPPRY